MPSVRLRSIAAAGLMAEIPQSRTPKTYSMEDPAAAFQELCDFIRIRVHRRSSAAITALANYEVLHVYILGCRMSTGMPRKPDSIRVELLPGTLDMLVLRTLRWGPQHGYGIAQRIRGQSSGVLEVETGSLYPALHRLEKQGWVRSQWKQSEANQRAKYYELTAKGRRQLSAEQDRWTRLVAAIGAVLEPEAES